jgi:hypothetical protein
MPTHSSSRVAGMTSHCERTRLHPSRKAAWAFAPEECCFRFVTGKGVVAGSTTVRGRWGDRNVR